ncbi:MAG: hypothetical protein U0941_14215 [Planctomycetaceae bacterium]
MVSEELWEDWRNWTAILVQTAAAISMLCFPSTTFGRTSGLILFSVFTGILSRLIANGETSCGCFGKTSPPPTLVVAFDLLAISGICAANLQGNASKLRATAALIGLSGLSAATGYFIQPHVSIHALEKAQSRPDARPLTWQGRKLPISRSLPANLQLKLDNQDLLLVLFNPNCDLCKSNVVQFARSLETQPGESITPSIILLSTSRVSPTDPLLPILKSSRLQLEVIQDSLVFVEKPAFLVTKRGIVITASTEANAAIAEFRRVPQAVASDGPNWIQIARDATPELKTKAGQPSYIQTSFSQHLTHCAVGGTYTVPIWLTNKGNVDVNLVGATADCSCTIPLIAERKLSIGIPTPTLAFVSPKNQGNGDVSILFTTTNNNEQEFSIGRIAYHTNSRFLVTPNSRQTIDPRSPQKVGFRVTGDKDWEYHSCISSFPSEIDIQVSPVSLDSKSIAVSIDLTGKRNSCRTTEAIWLVFRNHTTRNPTAVGLVASIVHDEEPLQTHPHTAMCYPATVKRVSLTEAKATYKLSDFPQEGIPTLANSSIQGTVDHIAASHQIIGDEILITLTGDFGEDSSHFCFVPWMFGNSSTISPVFVPRQPQTQ